MNGFAIGALLLAGLVPALLLTLVAAFSLCGVSGCSGGGFGRSTDPVTTRALLIAVGVCAATPLGCYAAWTRNRRLAIGGVTLAVLTTIIAGLLIGADVRGCPRQVSAQTCADESR